MISSIQPTAPASTPSMSVLNATDKEVLSKGIATRDPTRENSRGAGPMNAGQSEELSSVKSMARVIGTLHLRERAVLHKI